MPADSEKPTLNNSDESEMVLIPAGEFIYGLNQKQLSGGYHKNIAYKPKEEKVTGVESHTPEDTARLHAIMAHYCEQTSAFVDSACSSATSC